MDVRRTLVRLLESFSFTVMPTASGEEALELFDPAEPPDVIVTDIVLPNLNGLDVVEALRNVVPDLPAVFLSGIWSLASLKGPEFDHNSAFVAKPIEINALSQALTDVLA